MEYLKKQQSHENMSFIKKTADCRGIVAKGNVKFPGALLQVDNKTVLHFSCMQLFQESFVVLLVFVHFIGRKTVECI